MWQSNAKGVNNFLLFHPIVFFGWKSHALLALVEYNANFVSQTRPSNSLKAAKNCCFVQNQKGNERKHFSPTFLFSGLSWLDSWRQIYFKTTSTTESYEELEPPRGSFQFIFQASFCLLCTLLRQTFVVCLRSWKKEAENSFAEVLFCSNCYSEVARQRQIILSSAADNAKDSDLFQICKNSGQWSQWTVSDGDKEMKKLIVFKETLWWHLWVRDMLKQLLGVVSLSKLGWANQNEKPLWAGTSTNFATRPFN